MRLPALAVAAALLPFHAAASDVWQVNLVGDMYPDGRTIEHPTPAKPVYYYAVVDGYQELGQTGKGMQPPPVHDIVHHLALALASQGYLVTHEITVPASAGATNPGEKAFSPPPSLILAFSWGALYSMNDSPSHDADDDTGGHQPIVYNANTIIGLTAGKNFDSVADLGMQTQDIFDEATDDHFFAMVSAYDFKAYFRDHKKILLWVAKMSVPAKGNVMADVIPKLIDAGGSLFGRETMGPKMLDVPKAPEGHVEVGTPTVKDYQAPSGEKIPP